MRRPSLPTAATASAPVRADGRGDIWSRVGAGVALGAAVLGLLLFRRGASRARDRRRNALNAERQRLFGLLNLAPLLVRDPDGTIRFWSEGCRQLYGWTAAEAVGRRAHELLRSAFPVPLSEIEATIEREGAWSGEVRHVTRAGATLIASVRMNGGRDEAGRLVAVTETLSDITAQRQAEAALEDSQARLRSVVETAAEGIVVASIEGRIVSANPAALRIFGYAGEADLVGRDLVVLMPPTEAARHPSYVTAHREGAPPRAIGVPGRQLLARRRDGTEFPIELSVSSFSSGGRRYLTGIIRDASERKRAEAALWASEARLRLVQRVGRTASFEWLTGEDEIVVYPQFRRLYGLPPEQERISWAEWEALLHPGDRARVARELRALADRHGSLESEFRILPRTGDQRWVLSRAELIDDDGGGRRRVIGAQQDVTEIAAAREAIALRKQELERLVADRTAALAEAESRFRAIFDSQFQFIGLVAPDGIVLETNHTSLEVAGLQRADVLGRPLWEAGWWLPAERPQIERDVRLAAQGALIRREVEIRGAGGRPIWIDFSLKPVRDEQSGAVTWIIPEGRAARVK